MKTKMSTVMKTKLNYFYVILTMIFTLTGNAFAAHPNWEFPFLRGLSVAAEELATDTADIGDANLWEHHVKVRYNMGVAMANKLKSLLYTMQDYGIKMQLQELANDLHQAPHYSVTAFLIDDAVAWADLANRQREFYMDIYARIDQMLDQVRKSPDHIEYPFLMGLSVAAEGLIHATKFDFGDADLWAHHFDLRMNAAYAMRDKLQQALSDLPPEHDGFREDVLSIAREIDSFPNYVRTGDSDYWAREGALQQDMFLRVHAMTNDLLERAKEGTCQAGLLP